MHVRPATNRDRDDIYNIHWSAFAKDERELVARLAVNLLAEETTPEIISLVAEFDGMAIGHVAFSPVTIENDADFCGYILAPLGILPDYQKHGAGSKLIESGMQVVSETGADILFVYGDPKYYRRFGFSPEATECYLPPYELEYPFGWQAVALNQCATRKSPAKLVCVSSLNNQVLW